MKYTNLTDDPSLSSFKHQSVSVETKKSPKQIKITQKTDRATFISVLAVIIGCVSGLVSGFVGYQFTGLKLSKTNKTAESSELSNPALKEDIDEQLATIKVAKEVSESVVSIVVYKESESSSDVRNLNNSANDSKEPDLEKVTAGTGFIVTQDGYVVTNKHVVNEENGKYSVIFNDGEEASITLVDKDSFLDIAILKIDSKTDLKPVVLGDSNNILVGQTVITIGNSLGEFSNSVSKGIISGLGRDIVASDSNGDNPERLDNVIQTDASINMGNSGGPLIDIVGRVIGVNSAKSNKGENVGFAIPINSIKPILESIKQNGEIVRPFLGIKYTILDPAISKENNLPVDYGAWLNGTEETPAVLKGTPADQAGLKNNDIIIGLNGKNIDADNNLKELIQDYRVGDMIELKVLRDGKEVALKTILIKFPDSSN